MENDELEAADPACKLELEHVIGRRAYDRHNNVKIDCLDRIIYCASSLMVFLQDSIDPNAESYIKQTFLRPDVDVKQSISPEVSCFTLSDDRRRLFIGTNGVVAALYVWEIPTNIQMEKMELPQISMIYCMKVAFDSKQLLIIGVTPEFVGSIMFLDYS